MFNKLYDKIKETFLKSYRFILLLMVLTIIFSIKLPYVIDIPGGYINVSERIELENQYETEGSFNMAYVSEISATIPTIVYAFLNSKWDVYKNEEVLLENETMEDLLFRNKLALKEANNNAIITAYSKAGYEYEIVNQNFYVAYIDQNSNTNLKVGDLITYVDNKKINSKEEIGEIISNKEIGDIIEFKVINNDKEYKRTAKIVNIDGTKAVGIVIYEVLDLETNPEIEIETASSESGPSGGLMTALAIYNSLVEEDITGGNLIVGTGTIDANGNVGSIGGVKYKLLGAVKHKSKIFIIPNGENYEEAIQIKEKNNYDIEIIGVSTFDETLEKLKEYNEK